MSEKRCVYVPLLCFFFSPSFSFSFDHLMFALAIFRLVSALVLGEFLSIDKCPGDPFFDLKKRAPRSLVKSEPKVEICQFACFQRHLEG